VFDDVTYNTITTADYYYIT